MRIHLARHEIEMQNGFILVWIPEMWMILTHVESYGDNEITLLKNQIVVILALEANCEETRWIGVRNTTLGHERIHHTDTSGGGEFAQLLTCHFANASISSEDHRRFGLFDHVPCLSEHFFIRNRPTHFENLHWLQIKGASLFGNILVELHVSGTRLLSGGNLEALPHHLNSTLWISDWRVPLGQWRKHSQNIHNLMRLAMDTSSGTLSSDCYDRNSIKMGICNSGEHVCGAWSKSAKDYTRDV
mmetsp:Transcript_8575/g.31713  ORF Transcript_8575/g.31713 Transcript_8575/m.31713 type:complete len:244 (-) Transcript_8575:313-1044(-)